jgi:hypothetical protein
MAWTFDADDRLQLDVLMNLDQDPVLEHNSHVEDNVSLSVVRAWHHGYITGQDRVTNLEPPALTCNINRRLNLN